MRILEQVGHQGDTQWYTIDKLPKSAKKVDKRFIAQSEVSGNVHALCGDYDMYETEDGFIINAKKDCVLNHTAQAELSQKAFREAKELPMRDHRSSVIKKGLYYVGIQRRFNPLEKAMEKVVD